MSELDSAEMAKKKKIVIKADQADAAIQQASNPASADPTQQMKRSQQDIQKQLYGANI